MAAVKVTAENVLITAGCNQAYCLTTLSLVKAGEEIILPLPYYFNYQMWLDMQGIRARHVAFRPDNGGVPDLDESRGGNRPVDSGTGDHLAQ